MLESAFVATRLGQGVTTDPNVLRRFGRALHGDPPVGGAARRAAGLRSPAVFAARPRPRGANERPGPRSRTSRPSGAAVTRPSTLKLACDGGDMTCGLSNEQLQIVEDGAGSVDQVRVNARDRDSHVR